LSSSDDRTDVRASFVTHIAGFADPDASENFRRDR